MPALITHIRVVSAFILREISTRYGRSPGGYVWAFLEPIAFIAVMALLSSLVGRAPALGHSFLLFYSTGYLAFHMFKAMEHYLTSSISANRPLMSYPVVAPIDAVVARFILEGITSTLVATIILAAAVHMSRYSISIDWVLLIEAVTFAWGLALGVSMANIVLFFHYPLYQKFYQIVTRPLFLLSGIIYVPTRMPHPFEDYLLSNPVTHVVILFREGFYGTMGTDGLDMGFLAGSTAIVLAVGFTLFSFFNVSRLREK